MLCLAAPSSQSLAYTQKLRAIRACGRASSLHLESNVSAYDSVADGFLGLFLDVVAAVEPAERPRGGMSEVFIGRGHIG